MFKKYCSLDNLKPKDCDQPDQSDVWVAQEKVHGANFSLLTDGKTTCCARRGAIIGESEDFMGHAAILEEYYPKLRVLWELVRAEYSVENVQLIGEYFGGYYNTGNFKPLPGTKRIQKEVLYLDRNDFIVFDLLLDQKTYLAASTVARLATSAGFTMVPTLHKGTYEHVSSQSPEFQSTIPALYGMPEVKDNWAEGFVMKPDKDMGLFEFEMRVRKKKHPKFLEVKVKPKQPPREGQEKLEQELIPYLTVNRFNNTRSKLGDVHYMQLVCYTLDDAINEYLESCDADRSPPDLIKAVKKKLIPVAAGLFKQ